jgi:hypothetical protein
MVKVKEKQVGITISASSYAIIKAAAEADSRSVRMWLEVHIKSLPEAGCVLKDASPAPEPAPVLAPAAPAPVLAPSQTMEDILDDWNTDAL